MLPRGKLVITLAYLLAQVFFSIPALAAGDLLQGEINSDNINIRTDSTVSSEIICVVNKRERLDVLSELYGWYKVRLPSSAPAFIKKDFILLAENKTGKVTGNKVNIRLRPDIKSPILGKLNSGDTVNILEANGDWLKIAPVINCFGWINKSFITKLERKQIEPPIEVKEVVPSQAIEGLLKPKVFTRVATHKLITQDKVYLIKGDEAYLNSFNDKKVRITGKSVDPAKQKYPVIAAEKIEVIN
jgi:uncharacterized protein YgiM (DUF1202 family)